MRRGLLAAAFAAILVLSACGGGDPPVSERGATELHDRVAAVRAAVDAHDADGAERALETLQTAVDQLRRSGDVTAARAALILSAARSVRTQLVSITTTTTTTTTTLPPPVITGKAGKGDEEGGNGKGKGKQGDG